MTTEQPTEQPTEQQTHRQLYKLSQSLQPVNDVDTFDVSRLDPNLALRIAEGQRSPYEILKAFEGPPVLTDAQIDWLMQYPPFLSQIEAHRQQLAAEGHTFKFKAMVLAEEHLATADRIVRDEDTPSNVRADLVKWLAKVAGHEPSGKAGGDGGNTVTIVLNLDSNAEQKLTKGGEVIDV